MHICIYVFVDISFMYNICRWMHMCMLVGVCVSSSNVPALKMLSIPFCTYRFWCVKCHRFVMNPPLSNETIFQSLNMNWQLLHEDEWFHQNTSSNELEWYFCQKNSTEVRLFFGFACHISSRCIGMGIPIYMHTYRSMEKRLSSAK